MPNLSFSVQLMKTAMWLYKGFPQRNSSEWEHEEKEPDELETPGAFRTVAFVCSSIMIFCCCVGTFGNFMSLVIFTRRSMRKLSVNVLLAGLSAVDLVMVILAVPVFAVNGLNDFLLDKRLHENFYSVVIFALYPISMMAQTCSIYTFVLISVERYFAVVHPLKVKRMLTVKRARLAELLIFLFSVAYNFIRFFEYRPSPDKQSGYYKRYLRNNRIYFTVYYTSLYLITHFLIPFSIITTLNVYILRRLRRARRERERLSKAQQERGRTTKMIIVVTVLFALCNCLPFLINLWEAIDFGLFDDSPSHAMERECDDCEDILSHDHFEYDNLSDDDPALSTSSLAYLVLDLSNTLVVANAASPFIVCLIYCKRYRKLFWKYSTRICARSERNLPTPNYNSSNFSSMAHRPFSTSLDNFQSVIAINDFCPRSNCAKYTKMMGNSKQRNPMRKQRSAESQMRALRLMEQFALEERISRNSLPG